MGLVVEVREPRFEVRLTWLGDCAWLALDGELDIATADAAYAQLEAVRGAAELTIDLRRLTFMDASGLRLLLNARRYGPVVRVVRGPRCVQRVVELAAFEGRVEFVDGEPAPC